MTRDERVTEIEKELTTLRAQLANAPIANANVVAAMDRRLSKVEEQLGITNK